VTTANPACPFCGAVGRRLLEVFGAPMYQCGGCKLLFPFPFPSKDEMVRRHQSEEYAAHPYFAAGEELAEGDGLDFHHETLRMLRQHVPPGGRILDVGAGTGDFLRLAAREFSAAAVEPSPFLAARIRERLSCPVFVGAFEDYVPNEPLDAVVMMDIIEHAADPRAFLRHARHVLKPGGVLFVCTVDSRSLLYRLSPLVWRAARFSRKAEYILRRIYCYQHNWYFNRRVLRRSVEQAGFTPLIHEGYEFPLNRLRESPTVVLGLRAIYAAQAVLGAQTEQYLLAQRS
jgi:2-polyprenyl-3-methyl-5-hydroxy-6-metoxy-1,4-benzoquinol methylase